MSKNKKHYIGKLDGTETCSYCGCSRNETSGWLYHNDIRYCHKHGHSSKGKLPNYVENESFIYTTIGLNILTFINNNVRQTIDLGDKCKFLYKKYIEFSTMYFFEEEIITQIVFNKILKELFNTNHRKSHNICIWNDLVYDSNF